MIETPIIEPKQETTRKYAPEEAGKRAKDLYERELYHTLETEENLGKYLVIDVETDEYSMDSDPIVALRKFEPLWGTGRLISLRVGYDVVAITHTSLRRIQR